MAAKKKGRKKSSKKSKAKRGTKAAKKTARKKAAKRSAKSRKADRARVAASQPHEVAYLARKHGKSTGEVKAAIARVGKMRTNVEAELQK